jgi:adenylate cyclase
MLSVDMRDFTRLSVGLPGERVAGILNEFFDAVVPPVTLRHGEVLKFIGDGVLAVFPDADCSARAAAQRALGAAREMLARVPLADGGELAAGVALHYGEAVYGNVGAAARLDFTVIGRDVNLLARIERLCGPLGRPLLASERFAELVGEACRPIGRYPLKGFDEPQAIFAPPIEA